MTEQLQHSNTSFSKKQFPITIVCDSITGASNIGSIFRLADAFGVEEIIFTGVEPIFTKRMEKTARATHKIIPYKYIENEKNLFKEWKKEKKHVIALEITNNSIPLSSMDIPQNTALVIVVGNENYGVSKKWLEISNKVYHIEMYGNNSSMNLAQAIGICLYEVTNKMQM